MILRLCFLSILFVTTLISKEIEIPDELTPIEGASSILYSYELDEDPYFISRLNDDIFLIMTLDGNDIELLEYSLSRDTTILKMEFEYDTDESVENYLIRNNKLFLFTNFSTKESMIGLGSTGFFERLVTIDLLNYKVEDCKIVLTNFNRKILEDYKLENEWKFCSDSVNNDALTIDLEELEILPNRFRNTNVTFDKDSTVINYFAVTYHEDTKETYIYSANLDLNTLKTTSSLNKLNDGKTWINVNYIYLDDESNAYFIGNSSNEDSLSRKLYAGKITPGGVLTNKIQDISFTVKENWNNLGSFEAFKNKDGKIGLFGFSKHDDNDDSYEEPNSAIILLAFDLNSLDINYKEKSISIDEGIALNGDEENFRFNSINEVIETKDGYTLLTETNENTWTTTTDKFFNVSKSYNAYSENINLFSLDKELNIKWNKHIYRDFKDYSLKAGPYKSRLYDQTNSNATYLKPEVNGDVISFIYSTDEPEDEIISVSYNVNTGDKISQKAIFQNDGTMSYFPGNNIKVSENEYVGLLSEDDNFIVRYKLLK